MAPVLTGSRWPHPSSPSTAPLLQECFSDIEAIAASILDQGKTACSHAEAVGAAGLWAFKQGNVRLAWALGGSAHDLRSHMPITISDLRQLLSLLRQAVTEVGEVGFAGKLMDDARASLAAAAGMAGQQQADAVSALMRRVRAWRSMGYQVETCMALAAGSILYAADWWCRKLQREDEAQRDDQAGSGDAAGSSAGGSSQRRVQLVGAHEVRQHWRCYMQGFFVQLEAGTRSAGINLPPAAQHAVQELAGLARQGSAAAQAQLERLTDVDKNMATIFSVLEEVGGPAGGRADSKHSQRSAEPPLSAQHCHPQHAAQPPCLCRIADAVGVHLRQALPDHSWSLARPLAPPALNPQIEKTAVWRCTSEVVGNLGAGASDFASVRLLELYNEGLSGCMVLRKLQRAEARGELPPLAGFPAGAGAAA